MIVNLYIENSIKGAKAKTGKAMYLLESNLNGYLYTKNGLITRKNCTKNELELSCLIEGLKRLVKKSEIRIFTCNETLYGTMNNLWHIQWQKNGWRNSKGIPIKNAELWQQITELLDGHTWTITMEPHSYQKWMRNEITKEDK